MDPDKENQEKEGLNKIFTRSVTSNKIQIQRKQTYNDSNKPNEN